MTKPIIALLYDFDKTLCTTDMEDYAFIPALGYTPAEFWHKANTFGRENRMDGLLAYMYTMIAECRAQGKDLKRDFLVACGRSMELFPGVREWFQRINAFGEQQGVTIEHHGDPGVCERIGSGGGICPQQTARAEQDAAEIARDDADDIRHTCAAEHLQHRDAGRALRLAVVGVALRAVAQQVAPAVVPRVVVLLFARGDDLARLVLRAYRLHETEKARAFFHVFRRAIACGDAIAVHAQPSSLWMTNGSSRGHCSGWMITSSAMPSSR